MSKKNSILALCNRYDMTNSDFWKHIDMIIAQGFNAEGLKQLEQYAELFISRRLVYKRFSPLEQYGCAEGGGNHVIASLLAGASVGSDSLIAPEGSFQRERECAETQAARIEQWARVVGCWMDDADTQLPSLLGEQVAEGGEAHITKAIRLLNLLVWIIMFCRCWRLTASVCTMPISLKHASKCLVLEERATVLSK